MKKLLLLFFAALIACTPALAEKTIVQITPVTKITTANNKYLEGDYVNFKIVGTDKIVRGLITRYQENGFSGIPAILAIDQFKAADGSEYEGSISLKGNEHNGIMEILTDFAMFVRGGEVTIWPDKDVFELWRNE